MFASPQSFYNILLHDAGSTVIHDLLCHVSFWIYVVMLLVTQLFGSAWLDLARLGLARLVLARLGSSWLAAARLWLVLAQLGSLWLGSSWLDRARLG